MSLHCRRLSQSSLPWVLLAGLGVFLLLCGPALPARAGQVVGPSGTPSPSASPGASPSGTPIPVGPQLPAILPTATPSPAESVVIVTPTHTATAVPPTFTPTAAPTETPTAPPTLRPTRTPTATPVPPTATAVPPTATPVPPTPVPSATSIPLPTLAVEEDSAGGTGASSQVAGLLRRPELLGGIGALLVLGGIVLGVVIWRRGRGRSAPHSPQPGPKASPPVAAAAAGATAAKTVLARTPPAAGIPYLQSQGRSPALYCPLNQPLIRVGRGADQDLQIDQTFPGWETVSREHATMTCKGERCIVKDAGTTNGVRVDGRRTGQNVLLDGATVQFGQVPFTYHANRRGGAR